MNTVAAAPAGPRPDEVILQAAGGYIVSAAMQVAARLGIADLLASGARSAADLAGATGAHEDALYRVLRALSSVGVFAEGEGRTFSLTAAGELLRSDSPSRIRDLVVWLSDPFHFRVYAEMMHSTMTGHPAGDRVVGMPVFEYLAKDKELSESFNNAMTAFSASVIPAVLEKYDFSGIGVLVDVAGGHGEVLTSVLRRHPDMRGILMDIDHVIAGAAPRIAAMGLTDRCRAVAGDFFNGVPAGGDAYLMKHIIHDWDDERASTILRNIGTALGGKPDGKVILLEAVVQPGNQPDLMKLIDLEMLVLPGGRERSADQFAALFARSGFEMTSITPTESPLSVIEARPR